MQSLQRKCAMCADTSAIAHGRARATKGRLDASVRCRHVRCILFILCLDHARKVCIARSHHVTPLLAPAYFACFSYLFKTLRGIEEEGENWHAHEADAIHAHHHHHHTHSELEHLYAKYAKCARWILMQREAEWRHAAVQTYATKVCNVCRHGRSAHTR